MFVQYLETFLQIRSTIVQFKRLQLSAHCMDICITYTKSFGKISS